MSISQVPDIRAFGTGYHTQDLRKVQASERAEWYDARYDKTLLPPSSSIASGRALLADADIINLPIFQLASDFMANAVLGESPASSPNTQAQTAWVDENETMIDRALRRATRYWSIHDYAVFTAEPGYIRAIDPISYYRVGEPDQRDATVGHIIAYPYREPVLDEIQQGEAVFERIPNRIRVDKVYPDGQGATTQVFEYDGASIIGRALTGEESSPYTAVVTAGAGNAWYHGAKDLAARIILGISNVDQDLNRFRNRIRWYPNSVATDMTNEVPQEQRIEIADNGSVRVLNSGEVKAKIERRIRPVVILSGDDTDPMDDGAGGIMLDAPFEQLRTALDLFFMTSGLPPSSFGIGVGRGESGVARERAQDAASARARAYRRDLTDGLPILCERAGAPAGGPIGFNWSAPPFQDMTARQQELLSLHSAGIVTATEVRNSLGWRGNAPGDQETANNPAQTEREGD